MLMKRWVIGRLLAIATLGMTLVASLNVQASTDDDAWLVLQKAAVAAHALSYQGIFYYQAGSQFKPVQITHLFNGKGEFARNVVLDNSPREVFSQGNDLVIFNPRNERIVIEKRHGQNMFPAILPTNLDPVKESYSLRTGERDRVAGRPAQMLFLEPKDTLRYGYRFWIDTEYGLLLKSEMLNGHNEIIESIAFNQLGLMDILDLDWFQPKIDNKKSYVMEDDTAMITYNSVSTDWKLKDLPSGFRKVDQMIRMVHGKTLPVTQVVLSDGLASVSLFIEPITKNIKPRVGHKLVGDTSFFASVIDGYQLTVVGEVPEVTVAQIANAVVFKK
jgi:sigma-E factor negative regulatory protein RseB